jgi:glycosyltransferase involved in cell wall biosynthesis
MTYDLRFGGSERQMCEAALHLDRSRFTPHVACIRLQGGRRAELERAGVPVAEFSFPSFGSWRLLAAASRLARYLKRHRIRLVHTFDVPANIFGVPVACACRVPVVLSSQRAYRHLTPGPYHRLLKLTDRMVDGTVVNSANLLEHLVQSDRVRPSRLTLIRNSVDTARYSPGPGSAEALPHCAPVIGSTAMLRPEKGVRTLLEAFAALARKSPSAGLLLVGGGPMLGELEARVQELGLADRCLLTGAVADVLPWLRRMDIFVLPSLSEALSNSLMEAMAAGCAVVASNVGGNPELVVDGETGLLFPPGDLPALAEKLETLAGNEPLRRRLASAGRAFLERNFSREKSLGLLSDLYSRCLERNGAARS